MLHFRQGNWQWGQRTYLMGILNVTPDSFSDGGRFNQLENALKHGLEMVELGADIIDIGGESTRPGSAEVSAEEELNRVLPVVEHLAGQIAVPISIDTYKASVADACLRAGAQMVNDVWGFQREPEIAKVVAFHGGSACLMHNQEGTEYPGDIIDSMKAFFEVSLNIAIQAGIPQNQILLDPGVGFGKTAEQNIEVMGRLHELHSLGYPILLGTSRKSFIGKILDVVPTERVEGTVATTVLGIQQGVQVVRVHDIKENRRAALVTDAIVRGYQPWIKSV